MHIILLASSQPRVGKSTLTKILLKEIPHSAPLSFAVPIKEICYNLHADIMSHFGKDPEYSLEEYKQTKKDVNMEDIFTTSPRHQYCEGSNFISSLTSDSIWGQLASYNVSKLKDEGITTVIIDDWRRVLELNELSKNGDFKITTVYLDKEGVEAYVGSASTESFEGQINPLDCLINFTFKEDWSNTAEVVDLLKNYVKEVGCE